MVDNTQTDRSYLFGRLMALTQQLECRIPPIAAEGKTAIDNHMRNIVKNPSLWHDIHAKVVSTRLPGDYKIKDILIKEITYIISELFDEKDFLSKELLEPSYLLGMSQQLMDLNFQGGYRENAGRPSTGRKKQNIYVTDEEHTKVKEYIQELRRKGNEK